MEVCGRAGELEFRLNPKVTPVCPLPVNESFESLEEDFHDVGMVKLPPTEIRRRDPTLSARDRRAAPGTGFPTTHRFQHAIPDKGCPTHEFFFGIVLEHPSAAS